MPQRSASELKRRLAVHAINLSGYKADLEKAEKFRTEALNRGDSFDASFHKEIADSHRNKIEFIKDLIVQDAKALAEIQSTEDETK